MWLTDLRFGSCWTKALPSDHMAHPSCRHTQSHVHSVRIRSWNILSSAFWMWYLITRRREMSADPAFPSKDLTITFTICWHRTGITIISAAAAIPSQRENPFICRIPFRTAVPAAIIVTSIRIAPAVGLIMLFVVGIQMILECLRYWTTAYHVDGFRFDLATILGRNEDGSPMSIHHPVIPHLVKLKDRHQLHRIDSQLF